MHLSTHVHANVIKRFASLGAGILLTAAMTLAVHAQTAQDAEIKALAEKAAAYFEEHGVEAAKVAFETPGAWATLPMVISVQADGGILAINSASPHYTGINTLGFKDPDGFPFVAEILATTDTRWLDYKWQDADTKVIRNMRAYTVRVGTHVVSASSSY